MVESVVAAVKKLVERGSGGTAYRDIDLSLKEATSPTQAYFPGKNNGLGVSKNQKSNLYPFHLISKSVECQIKNK